MNRFVNTASVYPLALDDPRAAVLSVAGLAPDGQGRFDVTDRLQRLLDSVKEHDRRGIVLIPEGTYLIRKTVYLPRAVRMIGFGARRPRFILPRNTPGYQQEPPDDKGAARYMFWFTGNQPAVEGKIEDANPGTFYSAVSNIDFQIEENNPAAVVLRAHFAQHGFVSHCVFDIGGGKAGIFDVGNEMENLLFLGGDYGIYTTKCSPGWPFVLVGSAFEGQRKAAVQSRECGLTFSHVHFKNVPAAVDVMDGYWEKLFCKDSVFEEISGPALRVAREDNACTQINLRGVHCRDVPVLMLQKESGKTLAIAHARYQVTELSHGDRLTLGETDPIRETVARIEELEAFDPRFEPETRIVPAQETWVSVRQYGALGNGEADDTAAIQKALDENNAVYLPQGLYRVSDTVRLRPGAALIGMNPITTQLILSENTPGYAGLGSPKAVLESSRGGADFVCGVAIDTACRNPRAVGCKWMAGADSYMNDVKFVGGHGQITPAEENVPVYNPSRTADVDPERPWDTQYASLWITQGGGGVFKDIWSASTYALAGVFLSETSTPGVMYQVSVEHHVRSEILMRGVSNWQFYGMQTEEEVAEGSYCQPYELSDCHEMTFANFYAFRVIWVDNPYPSVVRAWNCSNIEFLNCHNFTQMKYTIHDLYRDVGTGAGAPFWQLSRLYIPGETDGAQMPREKGEVRLLCEGLDYVDSLCADSRGDLYLCDSRLRRIYRWDHLRARLCFVCALPFRPLSLVCDSEDRLIVVCEYKPVPHSVVDGKDEMASDGFEDRVESSGGCYFPFFRLDRRIRVFSMDPACPEDSIRPIEAVPLEKARPQTLYYPHNQWRDSGDMMRSFGIKETLCYPAPDGKTAVAHHPSLARATGLTALHPGGDAYLVDEYNKCIVHVRVEEDFTLTNPRIFAEKGEYSFALSDEGDAYIPDALLFIFRGKEKRGAVRLEHRPANVLIAGDKRELLYITARDAFYVMKIK